MDTRHGLPFWRNELMKCYFCSEGKLIWSSDWNYDEVFGEGEGLVSLWYCCECGAEHQFSKRDDEEEA